jgi:asparagine synthase (glutamine-hydrolysing)
MCGISGIISVNKTINPQQLEVFNNITRHRGPDDEGYVLFTTDNQNQEVLFGNDTPENVKTVHLNYQPTDHIKNAEGGFQIALGHRRLSILDLSPLGHLPMCDESQRFWITYNGEVYNFIEIKEELISIGYTFKSTSDTEVILNAYIEWGEKCLDKMMGMFAIAIFDKKNEEIF